MGREYRAEIFRTGDTVALRLPDALGLTEGEVILREEDGRLVLEPVVPPAAAEAPKRIDLTGIAGSIPGLTRVEFEDSPRAWNEVPDER